MAWAKTSFRSGAEQARQIPKRPPAVVPELSCESGGSAIVARPIRWSQSSPWNEVHKPHISFLTLRRLAKST